MEDEVVLMDSTDKNMPETVLDDILDYGRISATKEHASPDELYKDLIERVQKYHPSEDMSLIEKAYSVAYEAHKDQVRKSKEPYIIHPLSVAIILADMQLDKESIVAGLLHDVVEDTVMTEEDIVAQFGPDVALIVDGVTKLEKIKYNGDKLEFQAENLRKMFLAMAKDIRVIMVKLADRLHNMRTLQYMVPAKQIEISKETLEIYAPLAERLGISKVKVELDDLSLKYLKPDVYYDLVEQIATRKSERESYVQSIVDEVSKHIKDAGIEATIDGRVKHFFSIYKKMKNQDKRLDEIYDLFAIRIIVDSVKDCYAALGVIHEMYKPIPGRFKDYIAMPKANMYQSLHTTLIGSTGQPFEIQIRTYDMHRTAEYGIAAHWKYKEASDGKKPEESEAEKLTWLRQILDWQVNLSDNKEFLNLIKSDFDLFSDTVYCFTPEGDVKTLPAGSNPIDFAYAIHSGVGNRMSGARVNGQLVSINYEIKNGDRVEIITSQNVHGPSRDWLNIAKSGSARTKIKQWFKKERREENIERGKSMFEAELRSKGLSMDDISDDEILPLLLKKVACPNLEEMYSAIGYGGMTATRTVNRMKDELARLHNASEKKSVIDKVTEAAERRENNAQKAPKPVHGILVEGLDNCLIKFSRCCTPVPGDDIVGFITRGQGVSIHRTGCENYKRHSEREEDAGRWIDVSWADKISEVYTTTLAVISRERSGLVMDIATALNALNSKVRALNARDTSDGKTIVSITLEVKSLDELKVVINRLGGISGVTEVIRNGDKKK